MEIIFFYFYPCLAEFKCNAVVAWATVHSGEHVRWQFRRLIAPRLFEEDAMVAVDHQTVTA